VLDRYLTPGISAGGRAQTASGVELRFRRLEATSGGGGLCR